MRMTTVVVLLAGLTAAGCGLGARGDEPAPDELVLRGYPAPGRAGSLASAIGSLLRLGEQPVGSARVGPGDQLLVLAPRSVHQNLEELIRASAAEEVTTSPPSILMTYWFVAARPSAEPSPAPADLREIASALDEVSAVQGPLEFRLIDRLQLRQVTDVQAQGTSPNLQVSQNVSISGGEVVAWVDANPAGRNRISTTIRLRPEQLLVLGQVALDAANDPFPTERPDRAAPARHSVPSSSLYLVIRADVDAPA